MVNAIPDTVILESYVRGATFDAIAENNKKVNRALCGAALSLGVNVEIIDMPGYSPLYNDDEMMLVAKEAAELAIPEEKTGFGETEMSTGSTDMGDLSCIMPVIQPYAGGTKGTSHGSDYEIADPERACVKNAKWQLAMLLILLGNGGERAKKIVSQYNAPFKSKEDFLSYVDNLNSSGERIKYKENTAEILL